MATDPAPTVYLPDGTPVKVRVVGAECVGEVGGDGGHYGYKPGTELADHATVYFEEADDA